MIHLRYEPGEIFAMNSKTETLNFKEIKYSSAFPKYLISYFFISSTKKPLDVKQWPSDLYGHIKTKCGRETLLYYKWGMASINNNPNRSK